MMYIHFCRKCSRFHILNGHKLTCPACHDSLTEMRMPYMDYINMSLSERDELLKNCRNEEFLKEMEAADQQEINELVTFRFGKAREREE